MRQTRQPVRGRLPRARLPAGPRAAAPGSGPLSQPRATTLTVSARDGRAQPRSGAPRTPSAARSALDRQGWRADLPPQGVKPRFKLINCGEMKVRLSQTILDTVGGRAMHFDQCSYPLRAPPLPAPPNLRPSFWIVELWGSWGRRSSKRFSYHPKDISLFIPKAHLKVLLFSN